jgi:hypothetical protein
MEPESDRTIVVDDEAAQDWVPLDFSALYASARGQISGDETDGDLRAVDSSPPNAVR